MLLTEPERKTMAYYLQEYQDQHIGVEPLAMALFELFNTHAKVTGATGPTISIGVGCFVGWAADKGRDPDVLAPGDWS